LFSDNKPVGKFLSGFLKIGQVLHFQFKSCRSVAHKRLIKLAERWRLVVAVELESFVNPPTHQGKNIISLDTPAFALTLAGDAIWIYILTCALSLRPSAHPLWRTPCRVQQNK
jgi:hypothetical protein